MTEEEIMQPTEKHQEKEIRPSKKVIEQVDCIISGTEPVSKKYFE